MDIPEASCVTAVGFAGADLSELYVTTSAFFGPRACSQSLARSHSASLSVASVRRCEPLASVGASDSGSRLGTTGAKEANDGLLFKITAPGSKGLPTSCYRG